MHTAAVKVQLKKLITLIDRKTGERTQEHPRFIKQDQVAIARFELSQSGQAICMEPFKHFPQLGRFILCDEGRTVAVGKVLKIVE
jgi:peptide chain release factor subunit 3